MPIPYRFQILFEFFRDIGASVLWGGLINWLSWAALKRAFDESDANGDGLFTISDVWLHFKNVFFATGDIVSLWIADTGLGEFFEINTQERLEGLSFGISLLCWLVLFGGFLGAAEKYHEWKRVRFLKD